MLSEVFMMFLSFKGADDKDGKRFNHLFQEARLHIEIQTSEPIEVPLNIWVTFQYKGECFKFYKQNTIICSADEVVVNGKSYKRAE